MIYGATFLEFCAAAAVVVGLLIGIITLLEKLTGALGRWVEGRIDNSRTGRLVDYHLGPNGTTPAIHLRLRDLEQAHGIEDGDKP
jgi:hypothetical protein